MMFLNYTTEAKKKKKAEKKKKKGNGEPSQEGEEGLEDDVDADKD